MATTPPDLKDFLQPVPICSGLATLATALKLLSQSHSDRLVLVDDWQHPMGWVSLHHLITQVIAAPSAPSDNLDRPFSLRLIDLDPPVIQPLTPILAEQSFFEFCQTLTQQTPPCYALVTERGELLGLLDWGLVLQSLALDSSGTGAKPGELINLDSARRKRHPPMPAPRLELSNSIQAFPPTQHQHQPPALTLQLTTSLSGLFTPWLELIERLPLALMLQTETGQPIAYNHAWLNQLKAIANPVGLWQAVAQSLETPPAGITPTQDHCTCTPQLENGQERVLHFSKVPLGRLMVGANQEIEALQLWTEPRAIPPFRLADFWGQPQPERSPPIGQTLWIVFAQDLTEQQHLAEELTARNVDLIHLNRLKDEFLACISHELRTPLTAVLGLASLLKDQTLGELNPRQVRYAELIYRSGRHLMAVVNDILDLTRMETGQLELQYAPVNLQTACEKAFEQAQQLRLLDGSVTATDLAPGRFQLEVDPALPPLVADEQRLRQMLVNLLSNALKFTDTEAALGLKVTRWGGWFAFTVWDEGMGIPADKQHLIFQKFQQLEDARTRRFDGTGLGLAITQRLARLHGGEVSFTSKEGKGCQFTILLPPRPPQSETLTQEFDEEFGEEFGEDAPAQSNDPEAFEEEPDGLGPRLGSPERCDLAQPRPTAMTTGSGLTPSIEINLALSQHSRIILVVTAVPHLVETLCDQLTILGYRVLIARSGPEALEKTRRIQPCLVMLNPVLPLLSGWDVLTLIKSNRDTRQIPVVLLGAKTTMEPQQPDKVNGRLTLPVSNGELQQRLAEWVDPVPQTPLPPGEKLTVLCLETGQGTAILDPQQLNQMLHQAGHRILEAEGLEQGELVARVWKPQVVILNETQTDWPEYFQELEHLPCLSALPWMTLTTTATQAANQVPGLVVFPCLFAQHDLPETEPSALIQVLHIAAGHRRQVSLLTVDITALVQADQRGAPDPRVAAAPGASSLGSAAGSSPQSQWLHAFTQYLHSSGFRALESSQLSVIHQQLFSQTLDAVVLCWQGSIAPELDAPLLELLKTLRSLPSGQDRPAILLLDRDGQTAPPLGLSQLVDRYLPVQMAMEEIVQEVRWAIEHLAELPLRFGLGLGAGEPMPPTPLPASPQPSRTLRPRLDQVPGQEPDQDADQDVNQDTDQGVNQDTQHIDQGVNQGAQHTDQGTQSTDQGAPPGPCPPRRSRISDPP